VAGVPRIPPLVGKKAAARILGCHPNNLKRDVPEMPPPLQERIDGMEVDATPLYTRAEIERLAARRLRDREQAAREAAKRLAASNK
jgi:hypothetical protein